MRVALVFNPSAGNFCPRDIARLDAAFTRAGATVSRHDSLTYRLDDQLSAPDLVCISGGDGTVRTVMNANGHAAHGATFCIHPSGTINLIAREAGYPRNPERFARAMTSRRAARAQFSGHINGLKFLCCASMGPDSRAVAAVSDQLKQRFGRLAYAMAFMGLLRRWPRQVIDVTIDGERRRGEGVMIFKARYYAGPFVLDHKADIASDQFRVLILPRARRRDYLRLIATGVFGQWLADPRWHRQSARRIEVDSHGAVPIQADGDVIANAPALIEILPEPLHFL